MGKKYLSLEEAAERLGLSSDELTRYREQGEIRGFADRGNWKFREQDIEEFARSQQADSSPDIPIITDPDKAQSTAGSDEPLSADIPASDSDVRLSFDESLFDEEGGGTDSDSDVRLSGDSGPRLGSGDDADDDSDSDVKLAGGSDSDVNLAGAGTEADIDLTGAPGDSDSDSDVLLADGSGTRLSDSDSDVRLTDHADDDSDPSLLSETDSDSDVKLMGTEDLVDDDSDSDVELSPGLARTDSDIRLVEEPGDQPAEAEAAAPDDSDLKLISPDSKTQQDEPDSGITLQSPGSSAKIEADESGISLDVDSGISLSADDSGISLESFDSGASLSADDSGISLEADDSGISLDFEDSGISLADEEDTNRTMPLDAIPGAAGALKDSGTDKTQLEIPSGETGSDSEFELAGLDDDDDDPGASTSVLRFEDEAADSGQTVAVPALSGDDAGTATDEDVFGAEEDEFEDEFDDELDDVHDAEDFGDEEFIDDEGQESGFAAPTGPRSYARSEPEWGWPTKTGIGIGAVLAILCSVVGVELVRTMWLWTQPGTQQQSGILELFGGMF